MKKNRFKHLLIGAGLVGAAAFVIHRLREGEGKLALHHQEREAQKFLEDLYGRDAMANKKVKIIDQDEHTSKADLARDFVDYQMHKE